MNKIGFFLILYQFFAIHKTKFGKEKIIFHKTERISPSHASFSIQIVDFFSSSFLFCRHRRFHHHLYGIFSHLFCFNTHFFRAKESYLLVMLLKCFSFPASQRKIARKIQKHPLLFMMNDSLNDKLFFRF